ncbi:MAG: hypothetical protein ACI3ZD_04380 [Prevotella sp.]
MVTTIRLKTPAAFDSEGVAGGRPSGENEEFGNEGGNTAIFTDFSLRKSTGNPDVHIDEEMKQRVYMMNPMNFISDTKATKAPHWYIRHGARDRDTSFPIPVCLALKLQNNGIDVDFKLPWNRPHAGDYALGELFTWLATLCHN